MIKNKLTLKESNDDFVEINGLKLPKDYVMQLINNASTLGMEDAKSVSDKLTNAKKEEPEEAQALSGRSGRDGNLGRSCVLRGCAQGRERV